MHTSTAVVLLSLAAVALGQTILSNQDAQYSGSSGGVGCGHKADYYLRVAVFEGLVFSFPTSGLVAANIDSVKFKFTPAACYRPDVVYINVYSTQADYKFNESACVTNTDAMVGTFRLSSSCAQVGDVDVTSQVITAINNNNGQVAFTMSGGLDDGADFNSCQFQEDGSLGCGAKVNGHDTPPSSFALQVTLKSQGSTASPSTAAPSTAAPSTSAPSTAAPSTAAPSTVAPSTSAPTTASPSTSAPSTKAPSSAPSSSAPSSAAPSTSAPSTKAPSTSSAQTSTSKPTTTKAVPTSTPVDLSGNNNARTSGTASNAAGFGFLVTLLIYVVSLC